MAVMVKFRVAGTREEHDAVDIKVTEGIDAMGGPPAGLMFHLSWPEDDGFVMIDVWRTEEEARQFLDRVVVPAMTAVGLRITDPIVRSVWGMARPPAS